MKASDLISKSKGDALCDQLARPNEHRKVRKDIARVKTFMRALKRNEQAGESK